MANLDHPASTPDEAARLAPNTARLSGVTPEGLWYEDRIADLERRLAAAEAERDEWKRRYAELSAALERAALRAGGG